MSEKTMHLELNVDEINLILEALGALPFVRVYMLIGRIQEHARRQLAEPAPAPAPESNGADRGRAR